MRIVLLQTDVTWASPQENVAHVTSLLSAASLSGNMKGALCVLPEMWATGFAVTPEGIAEDEASSEALAWMQHTARREGCALCGSLAVRVDDGTYRNRHYFVTPDATVYYDKHHLFTHGHEDRHFTAGRQAVVAQWQGFRLLLQTCYDLRFPVFARYGRRMKAIDGDSSQDWELLYDAIVYVANWPEKRKLAWEVLTRARAMENQCFVIAVNRTGNDPSCHYNGGSTIIDPLGRNMINNPIGESVALADIDLETLKEMRCRFRVLDDRDTIL